MLDKKDFENKVIAIGKLLHYSVEIRTECYFNGAYLRQNDEEISITNGQYGKDGRIVLYGNYPRSSDGGRVYGVNPVTITVSETRKPEAIARDIERRFLPTYRKRLAKAIENNRVTNEHIAHNIAGMESLAEATGSEVRWKTNREAGDGAIYPERTDGGSIYSIEYTGARVKIKLEDMPLYQALNLIAFLKNKRLATITVSKEDIEEYGQEHDLTPEETQYLIDNIDEITDNVIQYIQDTEWRSCFAEACSGWIYGYRMKKSS